MFLTLNSLSIPIQRNPLSIPIQRNPLSIPIQRNYLPLKITYCRVAVQGCSHKLPSWKCRICLSTWLINIKLTECKSNENDKLASISPCDVNVAIIKKLLSICWKKLAWNVTLLDQYNAFTDKTYLKYQSSFRHDS